MLPLGHTGQNKSDLQTWAAFPKALQELKPTSTIDLKVNEKGLSLQPSQWLWNMSVLQQQWPESAALPHCPQQVAA